ncbi:hypothetical protein [Acetobacter sicerae]|uniref:hypothetical protein n=1 Tax=Acetobacter sicerae TaxID=85325 RepID=UPI00156A81EB|nr:hypothetical protein [Acetobacter sicerae]NHN90962.1 hypothetical protein [Acetobacter sicerae]
MIAVIQCAARKRKDAGYLKRDDGTKVMIVADPAKASSEEGIAFSRPDDFSSSGLSWRDILTQYNAKPGNNPLGLLPAYQLYENPVYVSLANYVGIEKLYILSAGWGLIRADFLTPQYDITFSKSVKKSAPFKYRSKNDPFDDFRSIPSDTEEPITFFGGKDYLPLFCKLTKGLRGTKTIYYNSRNEPDARCCNLIEFPTRTRTNWHYECVNAFIEGRLDKRI